MKLSNIFEQDPAQAAALGANALKKTLGANTSGSMVSKHQANQIKAAH